MHYNGTCPYCDEPLNHGTGAITNGLHEACNNQLREEMSEHAAERRETILISVDEMCRYYEDSENNTNYSLNPYELETGVFV